MSERRFPDMWVDPEDDPRESDTDAVGELATLWEYLARYRTTLEMKCDGLDAEQLVRRSVPPSTMSLLGLVRHLAQVEHSWFQRVLQGKGEPRLFKSLEDRDLDFNGAVADPAVVEEAWTVWRREVAAAEAWKARRREVAAAEAWKAAGVDLDATVLHHDQSIAVRDIVVHMVEEYARHVGHADLLRECIDGRTGQ